MRKSAKTKLRRSYFASRTNLLILSGVLLVTLLLLVSQVQIPSRYNSRAQTPPLTNCTVNAADEAIDQEEARMLELVNNYRQAQGAQPLKLSKTLTRAATWLSVDMNTSKTLSHTDSTGRDFVVRIVQCGYDGNSDAENISDLSVDAQQVIGYWGSSPVHNSNLLSTLFTVVGISRSDKYWVLDFGTDFASGDSEINPSDPQPSSPVPPSTQPSMTIPSPGCLGSCQAPSSAPQPTVVVPDNPEPSGEPQTPDLSPEPSGGELPPVENPENPEQEQGDTGLIGLILNFLKMLLELLSSLFNN